MFKEKNLSKLIFAVPIAFIILTASIITIIHITQADAKFKSDSLKLKQTFLDDEQLRVNTILDSISTYIHFKKSSSLNILKDKVKSRVDFADKMLIKLYNNSIGIESKSSIQINLLSSLSSIKSKNNGRYFIFGYQNSNDKFLVPTINNLPNYNEIYTNKDFLIQFNELMKNKNEGFIFYNEEDKSTKLGFEPKLTYIKKFENLNLIIGYTEYISYFNEQTKSEVLNRLGLMRMHNKGVIFTLDNNFDFIQHSKNSFNLGKKFSSVEKDNVMLDSIFSYSKMSKLDLIERNEKSYWKKIDTNTYNLYIFKYINDWDWLVGISVKVENIQKHIDQIIGIKEAQRNESIKDSIRASGIFILIASLLSFFISRFISRSFNNYRNRIESQKNALKNINATLESKVEEKTIQLEMLNTKLKNKFKIEVRKNRKKDQMLYNQSKMASMGEMIGNIAHQWRQPLSTISTIASGNSLRMDLKILSEKELKEDLSKIVETTKHLSNTIEDFRNFFMEDKKVEKFDLVDVMNKNLSLISASMQNNHISIIKNFNCVEVTGIKNELLQGLLNILNNSRDILIEKPEDNRLVVIDIYEDEKGGNIIIKDSGGGIPQDLLEKIFEPYFTTKDKSHGTGIGLYMTREIIVSHMNGNLTVSNEEFVIEDLLYTGACFKITLPLE